MSEKCVQTSVIKGFLTLVLLLPAAGQAGAGAAAYRISGPEAMAAGQVYLIRVEAQADTGKNWTSADPDRFQVAVSGAGELVVDPALKPMNPLTIAIPAAASGEVNVLVTATNGVVASRRFTLGPPPPPRECVAEINPTRVTHRFAGLGGGVLFYDNQFDIGRGSELYDWCFADVKAAFLHLLIRPDCEPGNDNDDWRKLAGSGFDFQSAGRAWRIAREALRRNPGLKVYASLYTPPAWMKSNDSRRGDGTLKDGPGYRQELAEFVFAWLKQAQAQGVPVHYLAFFNEPDWPHTQDGMHFKDLGVLADTFAECAAALDALIAADGSLKVKPLQVFPDALGPGSITRGGANTERLRARTDKLDRADVWGVHDYWNTGGDYWVNRYRELRAFPGVGDKPIWMTEWAQRYRHGDLDSALEYARNMLNALRSGAEAWMVFEWIHPYGNQSGLISTDWGEQTGERRYWRSKAYHVFRQIANTTPAGSEVVEMKAVSGGEGVEYLALRHAGRVIVHLVNSGSTPVNVTLRLGAATHRVVQGWQTTPFTDMQSVQTARSGAPGASGQVQPGYSIPAYALVTLTMQE